MKQTHFISFTIIDHMEGGGVVGVGRTFFTTHLPIGERVLSHIEQRVIAPGLAPGHAATITNIVPVEGDGS